MLRDAVIAALLVGCGGTDPVALLDDAEIAQVASMSPRPPMPDDPTNRVADDPAAARLGQFLFFDPRLSANGDVSCASCHDPGLGFADGKALAEGVGTTGRHAPTVLDSAWNRWFFWDGRADSAWAQALGPVENPIEHGSSRLEVARHLHDDGDLRSAYEAIFGDLPPLDDTSRFPEGAARPDPANPDAAHNVAWSAMAEADRTAIDVVFANFGKAIAAYERRLVLGDSRFDAFVAAAVAGEDGAGTLTDEEVAGLRTFIGPAGCTDCHFGPSLTNGEFHNIGLGPRDWLTPDQGRWEGVDLVLTDPFNGQGAFSDAPDAPEVDERLRWLGNSSNNLGAFKTPSLRTAALSPPYFHGGHFDTLAEVVDYYVALEEQPDYGHTEGTLTRLALTDEAKAELVAFLEALPGDLPSDELLEAPPDPF